MEKFLRLKVKIGDKVSKGSVLALVESDMKIKLRKKFEKKQNKSRKKKKVKKKRKYITSNRKNY